MQVNRRIIQALTGITNRFYHSDKPKKVSLYSKISPLGNPSCSVTNELDEWVCKGNKIRFAEIQRIILDLRKRKRFSQALEVPPISSYFFLKVKKKIAFSVYCFYFVETFAAN